MHDIASTGQPTVTFGAMDYSSGKTSLDHFNFNMNVVVDGLLCLLGIVGNALTVLVVQKEKKRRTSNAVLLQALAMLDSCFLVYVMLYVVLRSIYPYTGQLKAIYDVQSYFVAFVLPFGWTAQTATIWMVMIMAVDRYLVVGHPLKANIWCTVSHAKKIAASVVIAAVLFNAVRWPRYYLVAFVSDSAESNSTFVSHLAADISGWNEELYRSIYHIGLTFVLLFIVPLGVISVVNMWLITAIHKAMEQRASMTHGNPCKKDASLNVTLMMVVMISVFVTCQLPDFIAGIIGAGNFKVDETIYNYYAGVKELLLVFNSACNFYLYLIFNRSMRNTFIQLFTKPDSRDGMQTNISSIQTTPLEAPKEVAPFNLDKERVLSLGKSSKV